ncbi:MAG: cellulase family glycosylhydrolase, partial [Hominimerdicola sp.]
MEKSISKRVASFILVICMVISLVPASGDFLDYSKVAAADSSNTFHVSGTKILDANGNEFIMRGINHAHVWYTDQLDTAIPAIANTGSNCVRLVFSNGTHTKYESDGWSNPATTATEMKNAIQKCIDNNLIPIVEVHDATGVNDVQALRDCANYWTQSDIKAVLNEYEKYVILNIANEWYGKHDQDGVWKSGYQEVIPTIRNAGINNMIMVDSAGWGQASDVLINDCTDVFNSDPNKNVVFSSHIYSCFTSDDKVTSLIDGVLSKNVPLVIGEFGWKQSYVNVAYKKVMSYCNEKGVGYIAWSWKGNGGSDECLDMASTWDGSSLTTWGSEAVEDIKNTSEICSIFGSSVKKISLSPSSTSFKTGEASDVTATINNLESNSLTSASCNGQTLSNGTDYSISGSSLTIKKSFLSSLSTGTHKITFNFSNSQSAVFTVTVSNDVVITSEETTLWEGSTDLDNWNGMVSIDGSLNVDWDKANLKVYYENGSSTQLQLAYNDSNGDWQTIVDYVGASSSPYTFELTSAQLSALKSAQGIFIKGTGATVTKVTAVNPDAVNIEADVKFSKTTGTFVTVTPKDINVTMELNGKTLTSATCNGKTLTAGSDYTVSDESLAIKTSFLSTLAVGSHTITFTFSNSKTVEFTVTVSDEEIKYDSVVLYEGSFETGNFEDLLEIKRGMGAWDYATLRLEYSITSGSGEL